MEPNKNEIQLSQYERDVYCGICTELGGVFLEKTKRGNPKRFRVKGIINYSLYGLIHGTWSQRENDSVDYSRASEEHGMIALLKRNLNKDQWDEFLFHKNMTPMEYRATRNQTWWESDLKKNEPLQSL